MCKELARKVKKIKILQKKTEAKDLLSGCIMSYKAYFSTILELKKMVKEDFLKYKESYYKKANDFLNSLLRDILFLILNYEVNLFKEITWIKSRKEFKKTLRVFSDESGKDFFIQSL